MMFGSMLVLGSIGCATIPADTAATVDDKGRAPAGGVGVYNEPNAALLAMGVDHLDMSTTAAGDVRIDVWANIGSDSAPLVFKVATVAVPSDAQPTMDVWTKAGPSHVGIEGPLDASGTHALTVDSIEMLTWDLDGHGTINASHPNPAALLYALTLTFSLVNLDFVDQTMGGTPAPENAACPPYVTVGACTTCGACAMGGPFAVACAGACATCLYCVDEATGASNAVKELVKPLIEDAADYIVNVLIPCEQQLRGEQAACLGDYDASFLGMKLAFQ